MHRPQNVQFWLIFQAVRPIEHLYDDGTRQRFKGLEYQRMILAGITDAAVPGQRAADDPARQQRELMRARSLLFVASTRACDALVISWNGQPSRFLPPGVVGSSLR